MTEAIIVALLGLAGTLAGSYLANRKSTALIVYRLEQLEQKVSKHNKLVERTYALEEAVALAEERQKVCWCDRTYKPSSVEYGNLSRLYVAAQL